MGRRIAGPGAVTPPWWVCYHAHYQSTIMAPGETRPQKQGSARAAHHHDRPLHHRALAVDPVQSGKLPMPTRSIDRNSAILPLYQAITNDLLR